MIPTGESIVFLSEDGTTFTKMKSPFAKAPMKHILPEDIIYEHLIHNILFPSTRYRFVGFSEDRRYADAPRVEALRQGTTLHKIIMQFKGWELARIEEIE